MWSRTTRWTWSEKRRILESWKKDAELLATAQDENMAGGERSHLQDVSLALERAGANQRQPALTPRRLRPQARYSSRFSRFAGEY